MRIGFQHQFWQLERMGNNIPISEKDIAKENMVGVARIELATPAMSTQCSTTELYAHSAPASSGAWCIIQAYFNLPKHSLVKSRSTSRTRSSRWKGLARILAFAADAPARRATLRCHDQKRPLHSLLAPTPARDMRA